MRSGRETIGSAALSASRANNLVGGSPNEVGAQRASGQSTAQLPPLVGARHGRTIVTDQHSNLTKT